MADRTSLFSTLHNLAYNYKSRLYLQNKVKDSLDVIQRLRLEHRLTVHNGCVNTICWNDDGNYILSGSDDQHLVITNPFSQKVEVDVHSGHRANIFSAKFLPTTGDRQIVSCSGDGMIYYTNLDHDSTTGYNCFDCHFGTAYEVLTIPQDPNSFLSCGEDGTVRWFDLRVKDKCNKEDCKEDVLINCRRAVTSIAINPLLPYQLSVGCSDSTVRIYDRRMLGTRATGNHSTRSLTGLITRFSAPSLEGRYHRITSLAYSHDAQELLVSYSSEHVYLFNMKEENKEPKELKKEDTSPIQEEEKAVECSEPPPSAPVAECDPTPTSPTEEDPQPSTSGTGAEGATGDEAAAKGSKQPPIKRLRLRGDWSDTGPNARPERERREGDEAAASIMQRMSDMLTRWLEGSRQPEDEGHDENEASQGQQDGQGSDDSQSATRPEGQEVTSNQSESATPNVTSQENTGGDLNPSGEESASVMEDITVRDDSGVQERVSVERISRCSSQTDLVARMEESCDIASANQGATICDSSTNQGQDPEQEVMDFKEDRDEHTCISAMASALSDESNQQRQNEGMDLTAKQPCVAHPPSAESQSMSDMDDLFAEGPEEPSQPSGPDEISQEAVERMRREAVAINRSMPRSGREPIISLHYSSQGADSSTIRMDFTSTGNSAHQQPQPSSSNVEGHVVTQAHTNGNQVHVRIEDEGEETPGESHSADTVPTQQIPSANQQQSETSQPELDAGNTATATEPLMGQSQKRPHSSTSDGEGLETPQEELARCVDEAPSEMDTSQAETNIVEDLEGSQVIDDNNQVSQGETDSRVDDASRSQDTGSHDVTDRNDQGSNTTGDREEGATGGEDAEGQGPSGLRYSRDYERQGSPASASSSGSGRQRRHGHSGPPTGDFQLNNSDNPHDSSSDDSDEGDMELMRAAQRSRRGRFGPRVVTPWNHREDTNLDRSVAAVRLQKLYRKRQEERQREEERMMDLPQPTLRATYKGHRNARTMIKEATFWGQHYVMSGSDCGHVFVWDRHSQRLVMLLEADKHVVNCVQPHPYDPVLATSGIDYDVKIWTPSHDGSAFDEARANEIEMRNRVMLEETRDTITVPASFMLRMLASLNHFRSARRSGAAADHAGSSSMSSDESDH